MIVCVCMYMYAVVVNKELITFIDVSVSLILHIIRHVRECPRVCMLHSRSVRECVCYTPVVSASVYTTQSQCPRVCMLHTPSVRECVCYTPVVSASVYVTHP